MSARHDFELAVEPNGTILVRQGGAAVALDPDQMKDFIRELVDVWIIADQTRRSQAPK